MNKKVPGNCETIVFHFFCFLAFVISNQNYILCGTAIWYTSWLTLWWYGKVPISSNCHVDFRSGISSVYSNQVKKCLKTAKKVKFSSKGMYICKIYSIPDILMADDRYFWAKTRRNYDFEKGGMQLCFPFGFFYEIANARERIFVRNGYPSPCDGASFFLFFWGNHVCSLPLTNKGTSRQEEENMWYP